MPQMPYLSDLCRTTDNYCFNVIIISYQVTWQWIWRIYFLLL